MTLTKIPLTIAYADSPRSRAYINAFLALNLCPEEIVVMGPEAVLSDSLVSEAEKYAYAEKFYDLSVTYADVAAPSVKVTLLDSLSINCDETVSTLKGVQSRYILFTGGGIVSGHTLGIGKDFIHIHPGVVPAYRGSTCFYYSLIEQGDVGATAFLMAEQLDEGPVIAKKRFTVNMDLAEDQASFLDHILDPVIRMKTLSGVLEKFIDESFDSLQGTNQRAGTIAPYYVMHPILRRLCWDRLKALHSPSEKQGILEADLNSHE